MSRGQQPSGHGPGPSDWFLIPYRGSEAMTDSVSRTGVTVTAHPAGDVIDPYDGHPDADFRSVELTEEIPVPAEVRTAAPLAPHHWIATLDPGWSMEGDPPVWAVDARWRTDAEGNIVEYQENHKYRPSPRVLGWPEPEDAVDDAVQQAATGYGDSRDVVRAMIEAKELAVAIRPDHELLAAVAGDGMPVVLVYTSPLYRRT